MTRLLRHVFSVVPLLLGLFGLVLASSAAAQPASRDLWLATVESERATSVEDVETVLREVLEGAGPGHIVGRAGVEAVLDNEGMRIPRCLRGFDACTSVESTLVESLGASRVIYAHVHDRGDAVDLRVVDVSTNRVQGESVRGEGLRDTLYEAVAALTGLTSALRVESSPDGARVFLDETLIGITPFRTTVGIGAYRLRMERDGYAVYATNIEVRPGEERVVGVELTRRYADVTVRCDAPGAEVFVDGDPRPRSVNVSLEIDPGERRLRVVAPDHVAMEIEVSLQAGEAREISAPLERTAEAVARDRMAAIEALPLGLELGFSGRAFSADWAGARVDRGGSTADVRCLLDEGGGCRGPAGAGLLGLELALVYDWAYFEIGLLGLSLERLRVRGDDRSFALENLLARARADAGRSVTLQLPQVGGRYLITPEWEVFLRTGPAIAWYRFRGEDLSNDSSISIRRSSFVWDLRFGARYHLSSRFYAFGTLHFGFQTSHADQGTRSGGTVGMGMSFRDPTRTDERLNRRFRSGEVVAPPSGYEELQ